MDRHTRLTVVFTQMPQESVEAMCCTARGLGEDKTRTELWESSGAAVETPGSQRGQNAGHLTEDVPAMGRVNPRVAMWIDAPRS